MYNSSLKTYCQSRGWSSWTSIKHNQEKKNQPHWISLTSETAFVAYCFHTQHASSHLPTHSAFCTVSAKFFISHLHRVQHKGYEVSALQSQTHTILRSNKWVNRVCFEVKSVQRKWSGNRNYGFSRSWTPLFMMWPSLSELWWVLVSKTQQGDWKKWGS